MSNPNSISSLTDTYNVRAGRPADILFLDGIERSAGQLFRTVGLDSVADDEPMPPEVLMSYLEAENLWVATTIPVRAEAREEEAVVAFLAAFPITITASPPTSPQSQPSSAAPLPPPSSCSSTNTTTTTTSRTLLHIAELSVHASHHRRGLGRRLLTHFEETAASSASSTHSNIVGLSLTTYRDLPFNGPFYAKLGFQEVLAGDIEFVVGKRGRELWGEEQAKIAKPERRCWMVKWLR